MQEWLREVLAKSAERRAQWPKAKREYLEQQLEIHYGYKPKPTTEDE